MKIQYLGFLPFIITYLLCTYKTWIEWKKDSSDFFPTFYRTIFIYGTIALMIGGTIWAFS